MTDCFSTLRPELKRAIADLGFIRPTPIQEKAIPPGRQGRDILACAMTGSGKTAAFLLPIMERLLQTKRGVTRALVLSPTRELAAQTVEQFEDLARHTRLRAAPVYGGVSMRPQEQAFRRGVDVIVACPGRLLDHFSRGYAGLEGLEVLVLDEADRMLDMGFLPDIRRVLKHLPTVEQSLLFSATMPQPIVTLSRELLRDPVRLDVERPAAPATGVVQSVYPIRQDLKATLLLELLQRGDIGNGLVFTRTKHRADRLAKKLTREGVSCDRIHGNRSQAQRTRALADFKSGKTRVLVATDIAARGIDVEDLSHVVNFDVPNQPDDYIHRVGRTARASATGEAFTFVAPEERGALHAIERAVKERLPRRELEGFAANAAREEALEIPHAERIAAIRAKKAEDRARSRAKAERKSQQGGSGQIGSGQRAARQTGSRQTGSRQAGESQTGSGRSKPAREAHGGSTGSRGRSSGGASSGKSRKAAPWWAKPAGDTAGRKRRSRDHKRPNR